MPIIFRPYLLSLGLLLPGYALAQATTTTPATVPAEAALPTPAAPAVARPTPDEVQAQSLTQAQATVPLLTRRVDSLRQTYRQQHLYSDLGGKFSSFLAGQKLSQTTRCTLPRATYRPPPTCCLSATAAPRSCAASRRRCAMPTSRRPSARPPIATRWAFRWLTTPSSSSPTRRWASARAAAW